MKLAKGHSFPLAPYFLWTSYSHLDRFTLDLQCSWGRFQVKTFVLVTFLQIWLWEHFRNYAPIPKALNSFKTSLPSPQGLPQSLGWNKVVVSSDNFLCKVLDDPSDWTIRPYSPLEGGLFFCSSLWRMKLSLVIEMLIGLRRSFLLQLVPLLPTFRHIFKIILRPKLITQRYLHANLVLTKAYWDILMPI